MLEFKEACKELDIPLVVLPPASPQYNGGVERSNRVFREEFYEDANGLKGLTPMEYVGNVLEAAELSHRG
jgi:transposase InsO family protein